MDNGTIQSGGGYSRYTFRKGTYLGAFLFASFEMDEHILECVDGYHFIYQSTYQLWVFFYYVKIL